MIDRLTEFYPFCSTNESTGTNESVIETKYEFSLFSAKIA